MSEPESDSTALALIRRLHQHRTLVNQMLLDAAEPLTEEQLRLPLPIGQGSLWRSLVHLFAAEYVWLEALEGNEQPVAPGDSPAGLPGNQAGAGPLQTLAELRSVWAELNLRWSASLGALRADQLGDLIYKISSSSLAGQRIGLARSDVLLHVCTHAQYTAAQVVNMLRQVGAPELPDVMLISLARREAVQARF